MENKDLNLELLNSLITLQQVINTLDTEVAYELLNPSWKTLEPNTTKEDMENELHKKSLELRVLIDYVVISFAK